VNLSDLRYIVALADHRHFGRAAKACFVSQPTLSTQVKKLERELGVALLERSPRQIRLTEAGEAVVERARIVVREADAIPSAATRAGDPEGGTVRIGVFPTLGPYLLPHVVPAIRDRYPRLELLLVEDKTDEILDQLRRGALDAVVVALPVAADGLTVRSLFAEEFVLALPDEHPLADGDAPVPTHALADIELILLDDGHCLRDQALDVCRLTAARERPGFRATSLETLRQMVAAGVGITLLPRLAVSPPVAPTRGVTLRELQAPAPRRTVAMAWRQTHPSVALLAALADLVVASTPASLVVDVA
jgi:LysR family hydrogen peroxide-inducible transcriptional activator